MRRALLLAAAALLATPGTAGGDGLPVGNVDVGDEGVVAPGGSDRIVALTSEVGTTAVARIDREGGTVERWRWLREPLTVPGVALDGTADGLSADGSRVVLIRPREVNHFPLRRTRLVALDARTLRVQRRLSLRGDFSFDALSPDGRRLYLVHYVDRRDPRKYVVRSYDLVRGRMERGAIVDAREPDEDMRGYPVTRETTTDGRWAYTLYDGVGEPFVHALDTVGRRAFCIDLPMLAGHASPQGLRLALRDGALEVDDGDRRAAIVDTRTMHASRPVTGMFGELAVAAAEGVTGSPSD
ncbi:MAG: hypothetical protein M3320_00930 [Actinomycetota bacterium]|nr:hypothetical protein [Actinomycetota bacterium]MDQ5807218.1 hypothetical protein [Actinomycetota bacterium]